MPYTHTGPPVYRTADGQLTTEDDPAAAFLVVATGGQLSDEDAQQYGLTTADKPAPAQNKAQAAPGQEKTAGLTIEPAPPPADADQDAPPRRKAGKKDE